MQTQLLLPSGLYHHTILFPIYITIDVPSRVYIFNVNSYLNSTMGFPGGSMIKNPRGSAGDTRDTGSIPGSERSPKEGNGDPLQYSCPENPMDRGAWLALDCGVAKSQIQLSTDSIMIHFLSIVYNCQIYCTKSLNHQVNQLLPCPRTLVVKTCLLKTKINIKSIMGKA